VEKKTARADATNWFRISRRNGRRPKLLCAGQNLLIIKKAIARMQAAKERGLDMQALARELNINYRTFRNVFRQYTGVSPGRYLLDLRLAHARNLLKETPQTATEIARQVGFRDENHFFHYFKKRVGMTPSEWRFHSLQKLNT
jgi:AraC family L-rhamnose operon transcriptional activator RhaR